MKANIVLELAEFVDALREYGRRKTGYEVGTVEVISYDKTRILVSEDDMVECSEFRHRAYKGHISAKRP